MEPVIVSANAQLAAATGDSEKGAGATESSEQSNDSFVATIIRIDQSTAEQLFRSARL